MRRRVLVVLRNAGSNLIVHTAVPLAQLSRWRIFLALLYTFARYFGTWCPAILIVVQIRVNR